MTKDTDWCSLIRQKINNLYTKYFDEEVILEKEYMDLLKTPYVLYYRWIKGTDMNAGELTDIIDCSFHKAVEVKAMYQKHKMQLSWDEYKDVIECFLKKIFDNCKLIDDYESEKLTNKYIYNFVTEDNFYIKYICRSLESYMLNYQKEYYGLKRGRNKQYKRCKECGVLIEIKNKKDFSTKYCSDCKREKTLEKHRKYNKKRIKK